MSLESNLTPSTELEAVNEIISVIGEDPVNSLTDTGLPEIASARQQLRTSSRKLQAKGWTFNIDSNWILALNTDNEIELSPGMLHVDPERSSGVNAIQRGNKLWNQDTNSWLFDEPVCATVTHMLPFSELPEAARRWITLDASKRFQVSNLGSDNLNRHIDEQLKEAWEDLFRDDVRRDDPNLNYSAESLAIRDRDADTFIRII